MAPPPAPAPKPVIAAPLHGKPHGKIALLIGIGIILFFGIGILEFFRASTASKEIATPSVPSAPEPQPSSPPISPTGETPSPLPQPSPFPEGSRPGIDSDSDGLTDIEEQLIYVTDPHLPDTDNDGFLDGNEVFHLYNPNAIAPATLIAAGLVKVYETSAAPSAKPLPYALFYPTVWSVNAQDAEPFNAVFAATTGESITLSLQAKTSATQTLDDWYKAQGLPPARASKTKGGLNDRISDNQLTVYVDAKAQVLVLNYSTGIKGAIDYLQTFKMMLNSLKIK